LPQIRYKKIRKHCIT